MSKTKNNLIHFVVNETTGRLDNIIEDSKVENLIQALRGITEISERP